MVEPTPEQYNKALRRSPLLFARFLDDGRAQIPPKTTGIDRRVWETWASLGEAEKEFGPHPTPEAEVGSHLNLTAEQVRAILDAGTIADTIT